MKICILLFVVGIAVAMSEAASFEAEAEARSQLLRDFSNDVNDNLEDFLEEENIKDPEAKVWTRMAGQLAMHAGRHLIRRIRFRRRRR